MNNISAIKINSSGKYALIVCPNPSIDIYAWVNDFKNGQPNRIIREERYPGGKGIHVAMALAELGVEVVVVGFWGSAAGEWIKEKCNHYYPAIRFEGINLNESSRSCYTFKTVVAKDHFDDTEILGTGPNLTEENLKDFSECVVKLLPDAQIIALSGSWPQGSPDDAYQKLVSSAKAYNVPAFIDCTGDQLKNALSEHPYCVHLNRKEITNYFNTSDFEKAKEELLSFCHVAAITDGANGLYYSSEGKTVHSLAKVDQVISTIGSGDCLLAGIIAGHLKKMEPQEIAKLGAACGAANCIRNELGLLFQEDVNKLFQKAKVF